jgi:hypothetical protein
VGATTRPGVCQLMCIGEVRLGRRARGHRPAGAWRRVGGERQPAVGGWPVSGLPDGVVTFVFSDIEGSTGLVKALREEYPRVLAEHRRLVRSLGRIRVRQVRRAIRRPAQLRQLPPRKAVCRARLPARHVLLCRRA